MHAYLRLRARFERIATIGEASAILSWDAATMMPPGAAAARGDQLAALAGLSHSLLVAPELADDLGLAETETETEFAEAPWDAANLALMSHTYRRATALPARLVEAQAKANADCETVWREARRTSDFARVLPWLETVINLTQEAAHALAGQLHLTPYDALMDGYQRGIGAADVAPVFADYVIFLADALPAAEERQTRRPQPQPLPGPFPAERQEALCRKLAGLAGLDFTHARLDRSLHPFCGGSPTDIRITTRYDEADCVQAVMGVLHETGHALYESALPASYARQPVGAAAGMAAHESQSLIVEMQACRSDAYLGWLSKELLAAFPEQTANAAAYAPANLARLWRRVSRGFIRVDADELTYPAHVILRFRLEQALIEGTLAARDLPGAWSDGLHALLGIRPPNDRLGCLQDIHWFDGAFGYFPSYTLGAMAAAQLMAAARREVTDLDAGLARGDLSPLMSWLRSGLHGRGSLLGFNDLLAGATGRPLDPAAFITHLRTRYLDD